MACGNCRLMSMTPLASKTLEWTNKQTVSKSLCINMGSQGMTSSHLSLSLLGYLTYGSGITVGMAPPSFCKPFDKASLEILVNEIKKCELVANKFSEFVTG